VGRHADLPQVKLLVQLDQAQDATAEHGGWPGVLEHQVQQFLGVVQVARSENIEPGQCDNEASSGMAMRFGYRLAQCLVSRSNRSNAATPASMAHRRPVVTCPRA
jgi:hypothetical protein